ncbi:MAG TPA: four-carbon acid sugar kinase family protein, partial [Chloroflexota bacterium]
MSKGAMRTTVSGERRTEAGDGSEAQASAPGSQPWPGPLSSGPCPLLGVVADDLTGAVDTGVQFARAGLETLVLLEPDTSLAAQVIVVTTDSRDEKPSEAYRRARDATRLLGGRFVYKKIDSTLRGNVGAEMDGLMDGLEIGRALVAPAFPATGRTTSGGIHMVNGIPLAESSFAHDPVWPARQSHLPTMLAGQTRRAVGYLSLDVVERGPRAVAEALASEPSPVIASDAVEARHLATLAIAMARSSERWLPCGSAGLAEEIPAAFGVAARQGRFQWPADPRPALVVAGSRHSSTAGQLRRAAANGDVVLVEMAPEEENHEARDRVDRSLREGRCVAIATTFSEYKQGRGKEAAEWLAAESAKVVLKDAVSGVFLTGGDVARAFCRALGAPALRALGEVQAGVAIAALAGGKRDGLRVVTKAGG